MKSSKDSYLIICWIPNTEGYIDFSSPLTYILRNQKISDDPNHPTYVDLFLETDEKGYPQRIIVKNSKNGKLIASFKVFKITPEGFLYLVIEDVNYVKDYDIKKTLYHKIKNFWHSDEYHNAEEDSILEALIIPFKKYGIDKKSFLKVLEHFISNFQIYFQYQRSLLENNKKSNKLKKVIRSAENTTIGRIISLLLYPLRVYRYFHLMELESKLNQILGVYHYYAVLRNIYISLTEKLNREIEEIEHLKELFLLRKEEIRSEKSLIVETVTILGLIVAIFGLLPLIYSLFPHYLTYLVIGFLVGYPLIAILYASLRR